MSIAFHQRVAVVSATGNHLRYVPGAMAGAMVLGGAARADVSGGGRIRAIVLARPADTHAQRIGPASDPAIGGVKFYRWRRLDTARIIEHHPRCTYE